MLGMNILATRSHKPGATQMYGNLRHDPKD